MLVNPVRCYYVYNAEGKRRTVAGFAVTRSLRKASERNHIKRRLRESFRLHKHQLVHPSGTKGELQIVFLFVGVKNGGIKVPDSKIINKAMSTILPRIQAELYSALQ